MVRFDWKYTAKEEFPEEAVMVIEKWEAKHPR